MKIGTNDVKDIKRGSIDINYVYRGENLIWTRIPAFPDINAPAYGQWEQTMAAWDYIRESWSTPSKVEVAKGSSDIYIHACSDKDGYIWFAPLRISPMLRIDPSNNSATTYASPPAQTGINKYHSCVYYEPSHCIYLSAYEAYRFAKYDIATNTFSLIGPSLTEGAKFGNGVMAGNGKIYFVPSSVNPGRVAILDPTDDSITTVDLGGAFTCFNNFVLAGNDFIYIFGGASPFPIIKFDTTNDTFTTLGTNMDRAYNSAYLDPVTDDVWLVGSHRVVGRWSYKTESLVTTYNTPNANDQWYGLCAGNNGRLYATTLAGTNRYLEIKTDGTPSFTTYGTTTPYRFNRMAYNGKIYAPANYSPNMLVIDTNNTTDIPLDGYLNRFIK